MKLNKWKSTIHSEFSHKYKSSNSIWIPFVAVGLVVHVSQSCTVGLCSRDYMLSRTTVDIYLSIYIYRNSFLKNTVHDADTSKRNNLNFIVSYIFYWGGYGIYKSFHLG